MLETGLQITLLNQFKLTLSMITSLMNTLIITLLSILQFYLDTNRDNKIKNPSFKMGFFMSNKQI